MYDMGSLKSVKEERKSPDYCLKILDRINVSPKNTRNFKS